MTDSNHLWWILVFAALLALGVTMLKRETAHEFPAITEAGAAAEETRVITNDTAPRV
jgi:hypothetical protein